MDNKCVTRGSTFAGVSAESTVKRWEGKQQQHIEVKCPDIVCPTISQWGVSI